MKKIEKLTEDAKDLKSLMLEKFKGNTRSKRGIPSDSVVSPNVAASALKCMRGNSWRERKSRGKAAKKAAFQDIRPKPSLETNTEVLVRFLMDYYYCQIFSFLAYIYYSSRY